MKLEIMRVALTIILVPILLAFILLAVIRAVCEIAYDELTLHGGHYG